MTDKELNTGEPVAWWDGNPKNAIGISKTKDCDDWLPLYTHPVKELPTKENEFWLMVEVLRAKVKEQQAEIEALKKQLAQANRVYDFDNPLLDKAQGK